MLGVVNHNTKKRDFREETSVSFGWKLAKKKTLDEKKNSVN